MLSICEHLDDDDLDPDSLEGITAKSLLFEYSSQQISVPDILVLDYMHAVGLGVAKRFLEALFFPREVRSQLIPYPQGVLNRY